MMAPRLSLSALGLGMVALITIEALAEPVRLAAIEPDGRTAAAAEPVLSPPAAAVSQALERLTASEPRERTVLQELRKLYEGRAFEPLWIASGEASAQALALASHLAAAAEEGLRPEDYPLPDLEAAVLDSDKALAAAEVELSRAIARYVLHLAAGRIDPGSVSRHITQTPPRPNLADALAKLAHDEDAAALMRRFAPPHPQYGALRDKLAELRQESGETGRVIVPEGPSLRPGDAGERIVLLRQRLGLEPPPDGDAALYDEALAEAVRAFQRKHRLTADAIVGPQTLRTLNGIGRDEAIAAIQTNMERLRWLPRDLGSFHVAVNVPEFRLRIFRDGSSVHDTRVIVGRPRNPTPTFSNAIDHVIVNPYWNVPASILTQELLPEIQQDPWGYFTRHNYQVLASWEGQTYIVDPTMVDWTNVDTRIFRVRQLPGDSNALGRIKFMFPNEHAVYLHDTPTKHLFQRDVRAFSHGCVRVDDPLAFAEALLAFEPDWNAAELRKHYGGPEKRINLRRQVPVHLTYFTAKVTEDGRLVTFADLYGYDGRMRELLGL